MSVPVPELPQHLLVDGNNIGRAWPETAALWKRSAGAAQQQVVERVRTWHDAMNWRVTVVFDGRGESLTVDTPTGEASFVVAWSARDATADTVIERWVGRSRDPSTCVVASGDAALASTVSATGAQTITPADLAAWVSRAQQNVQRRSNSPARKDPK